MGSEQGDDNERPVHEVSLPGFRIARYPVSNTQYADYVTTTGSRPPQHWKEGRTPEGKEHPVVHVSWREAMDFCLWLTKKMLNRGENMQVQLPSEAEWEFAAQGEKGREYPWGLGEPDAERCNFNDNVGDTTPVSAYPKGATPEGVQDLAGNVLEWTRSKLEKYPYPADEKKREKREALSGDARRVLRGGAFFNSPVRLSQPRPFRLPSRLCWFSGSGVPFAFSER